MTTDSQGVVVLKLLAVTKGKSYILRVLVPKSGSQICENLSCPVSACSIEAYTLVIEVLEL